MVAVCVFSIEDLFIFLLTDVLVSVKLLFFENMSNMCLGINIYSFIIFLLRTPIKLAASGNNTDKIAPPDLDCKIFFFL